MRRMGFRVTRAKSEHKRWSARARRVATTFVFATAAIVSTGAWATAAGRILWEDHEDTGLALSGPEPVGPNSSARLGDTVYVAGSYPFLGSPGSNADIHVRAYGAAGGDLRWDAVWAPSPYDDSVAGLAVAGDTVAVAGDTGSNAIGAGTNALVVQGFAADTGEVRWQDRCGTIRPSIASAIAAGADRFFVAGECRASGEELSAGLLRAYDARTGELLWEARSESAPTALAVDHGHLFGAASDGSGYLLLRSYDVATGAVAWQSESGTPAQTAARATPILTTGGGAVYAAWEGETDDGLTKTVAAFAASDGTELWTTDAGDSVRAMAWSAGQLFLAQSGAATLVRAYDARSGALDWQDAPGSSETTYSARAITTGGGRVFIGGSSYAPADEAAANFLVRAYSSSGRLLWEDNTPTSAQIDADATNVVWAGSALVASGHLGLATPPFAAGEWVARAYDLEPAASAGCAYRDAWRPAPTSSEPESASRSDAL